ncbi:MAG: hypothetical protein CMK64_11260 [Pseudoalteromonas sp.]|nr:hypothetical protein [Pseudoalteromonas sp.]|tara:strand:+ start:234 stop:1115 length:882 start_codon:yes stop_codon:yes gene_type:complete
MMSPNNFSIYYRSKSTENHTIDAEELGHSIVSFAKAIKQANRLINGPESDISIDVRAHKPGSFGVEFEVIQLLENARNVLEYLGVASATGAITGGSLIALIKKIGSRKIAATIKKTSGKSIIELDDGEEIECDTSLEELATNPEFRQHYENVFFNPVKDDDAAVISIKDLNGSEIEKVELSEVESFKKIDSRSINSKTEQSIKNIRFTQVNFDSGSRGWRAEVPGVDKDVAIKVADEAFLSAVDKSETALVKGSLFEVKLATKIFYKINQSPTYKYTILQVMRHRTNKDNKLV